MSTISSCVQSVCSTSQLADSPTESDLIQICLEQLPPNSKMSSLTLRDGLRHDPSLQGAQISTVWQRGLNGGGRGMRWKLKGGMARSAVILPQASSYAGPVRPGFGTRLLGKCGVFLPFRVMFRSVPPPRSSIHTSTRKINLQVHIRRNMHAWMLTEEESYWIIQMQTRERQKGGWGSGKGEEKKIQT